MPSPALAPLRRPLLPFAATVNPAAREAGRHTRHWATRMGLLGDESGPGWPAGCAPHAAARMYPRAPTGKLNLISDHLWWLLALDERFERLGRDGTAARALDPVHRAVLTARAGAAPPEGPTPDARRSNRAAPDDPASDRAAPDDAPSEQAVSGGGVAGPLVRAFADLHRRSGAALPRGCLTRLLDGLDGVLRGLAVEAASRHRRLPPNEAEYTALRRDTSRAGIFAVFTELAVGVELSPRVAARAEYRELIDCAADITGWDQDLAAVRRDSARGGPHNLVRVLARTHALSLPQAAQRTAERITRRGEDYLAAEYRLLCALEHAELPAVERLRHQRLVPALRDTLSGVIAWNHAWSQLGRPEPGSAAVSRPWR
ncbi:terpene synthase family protein [Streptomyces sp. SAJ15]|uniref:terpene synthase family protein n=1 Tax=Streptomyces sp. SAJ15 TaxID=2011095 RepID=UPI0016425B94|nr:terpene synthase family protein [Streptomyces sp. SAJ15]